MQVAALLSQDKRPDPEKVIGAMDDFICRCGSHPRMKKGIRRAAGLMSKGGRQA